MGLPEPVQEYSIDAVVEHYLRGWHHKIDALNHTPVRFELKASLQCPKQFLAYSGYRTLSEVLDHLTENAMWAVSQIVWDDLAELFARYMPTSPEMIRYETEVDGVHAVLRVSDTGCGMNPDSFGIRVADADAWIDSTGRTRDEYLMSQINLWSCRYDVSTKGTSGCGLAISEDRISGLGGRMFVSGTTYSHHGRLATIGEHNPDQTGTTITIRLPFVAQPPSYVID